MTKNLFLLLPPLTLGPLLLMGALHGSFGVTAPTAETTFVPQSIPLDRALIGNEATGTQLLDRAVQRLDPARVTWLHTQIHQKMTDRDATFEAQGTLQLGPHACARLDLRLAAGGRLLVVSDGRALAEVQRHGDEPAVVLGDALPADATRLQVLADKGCGGPRPLLLDLRLKLKRLKLQTGRYGKLAVIVVKGDLDADAVPELLRTALPVVQGQVYLDARTLWPHRVEWHGRTAAGVLKTVVEVEFRAPVLNRPLSQAECVRAFTYHPEAGS